MSKPPYIHIDPDKILHVDFDKILMSRYDMFYRRIVEYMLNIVENVEETNILVILVDPDNREYAMQLPPTGYKKSLSKTMEYFTYIEEYETCDLIKQIQKQIK
jgi:hypothetical protein